MGMTEFGMKRVFDASYDEVLGRITEALGTEGFGVLTEVDVKATLKKKLDVDFRRYKILGACNPPFAHKALQADLQVGLMMPCNVIVYEQDDGTTMVTAIDPSNTVAASGNPALTELAGEVKAKLSAALEKA